MLICVSRRCRASRLIGVSGKPVGVICPGMSITVSSSDSSLDRLMLLRFIRARFRFCSACPVSCAAVGLWSLVGAVAATVAGLVVGCVSESEDCLLLLLVDCSPVGVSRSLDLLRALRFGKRTPVVLELFPICAGVASTVGWCISYVCFVE